MSAGNEREFIDHLQNKEKGGRSMKCPLFYPHKMTNKGEWVENPRECLKEECAWWSEGKQHCAVFHIGASLYALGEMLQGIRDKMPHEEQFRR